MSGRQTSTRKRSASSAGMGPSNKDPATKKPKIASAIEAKLIQAQEVVTGLHPLWKHYAPDGFMTEMEFMRNRLKNLTHDTVRKYIARGLNDDLDALSILEINVDDHPLPTGSKQLEAAKIARKGIIGYITTVRGCLNALADQANVKPSPRDFAESKQWRVHQERPDAILCLRPADKRGLPIPLMHTVFCKFVHDFLEPPLDRDTPKYLSIADKLCQEMPSAFDTEPDRRDAFEEIFLAFDERLKPRVEHLLTRKVSTVKESTGYVDVAKIIDYEGGHLVILLEEFKVESTGDAYMQICRSYEVLCGEAKNERLLKFGYPVFLLCILGPYFMVCGAIKRQNAHVEPLTPLLPMFPGFGIEGRPVQIAHCLRALKEGVDALREFWHVVGVLEDVDKKSITNKLPEPSLVSGCPDNGILHFDDWQGTFESPMNDEIKSDKPPSFLAKIHKVGDEHHHRVVVKFVYSYSGKYGTTVHQYLYGLGLAPRLYCAETLHRGLVMVVMEHLSFEEGVGGWVELDTFEGKLGGAMLRVVREKLVKIIKLLQKQKMVHADLRPTNIMVKVDENHEMMLQENEPILHVVDFDWAGTVGEVHYPPFLNKKVPWPQGADAYQKVGEDDDMILLDNWWRAFVIGQPAV